MSAEEWGPWIEHDGRGLPVPRGTWVRVIHAYGLDEECAAGAGLVEGGDHGCWDWELCAACSYYPVRIIRYRIKKPRGLSLIEGILHDVEARDRVKA